MLFFESGHSTIQLFYSALHIILILQCTMTVMMQSLSTMALLLVLASLTSAREITVSGKLIFKGGQSALSSQNVYGILR